MIRAVTFTNYLGDSIRLDLARPEESGFIIKSVTGLGPGKANINTTEIATNDGSLFNSSRMPSRIGEASNITIYNTGTREVMRIDTDKLEKFTGSGIIAGDEIIICTVKGNKSITLLRNGKTTNILNCLDKNADWFQLAKGDNIFAYTAEYGSTNLQFKIENRIVYEGV